ncbi:tRNA (adenosine(37)-N6)-threonylcarbamoyltransferase complex ATPase subunit type 1 TsaE [Flavicella marina]|uniref:tRNA (adenosine(37)-N6)-threonylcarbamoyltransferase complex ATPase subunit type 1 TsaE n=1 Tax=Flavicella marina TaxID=1475951 RepID=UPI001264C827|nr:tRNA (adenosine(37)-N6)-threonylcarbamoyltransferase complex ATPase subunit type 1 TsaE [Flavicella marina]
MEIQYSLENLDKTAQAILKNAQHKTFLFYGEMGMGKTTLIKELAKQLGVEDDVSSPTFSIVNEYKAKNNFVYHFDFYRINDEEEAYDMGLEEYFYRDAWVFIEWPSILENLVPLESVKLTLTKNDDNSRTIKLEN